jgi:hypothetical protein
MDTSIEGEKPEMGAPTVLHDVHEGAGVDDGVAVGRDLGVGGVFKLKDIHQLEFGVGWRFRCSSGGEGADEEENDSSGSENSHRTLLVYNQE